MTNKSQCSPKEWIRLSTPLEQIDPILEDFANLKNISLGVNVDNYPNREFRWTYRIERIIKIYLEDKNDLKWSLKIIANQYRNSRNMTKNKCILKDLSINDLQSQLPMKLEQAFDIVSSWDASQLGSH